MQPILILSPLLGTPITQGACSIPAPLWALEKVGVRQPILILSPLNPLKQKYHLPPPPVAIFLPLHLHLQVINDEKAISSHTCWGPEPPPPSSWPPNPPTRPPPLKVARKREGVGVWGCLSCGTYGAPCGVQFR